MTLRARFRRLPDAIQEELHEEYGTPKEAAQRNHGCEEHDKDLFRSGEHFGFFCSTCGKRLGNWISHEDINDHDRENARTDRDAVVEKHRRKLKKAKERHLEWLVEMGERRANSAADVPPTTASGPVWHEYFQGLTKYSHEWRQAYKAYIQSNWWKSRKRRVLDEKGRTCRLRYDGCTGEAEEVHHKSYDLIGFEPLHDLEPACRSCHRTLHKFRDEHAAV